MSKWLDDLTATIGKAGNLAATSLETFRKIMPQNPVNSTTPSRDVLFGPQLPPTPNAPVEKTGNLPGGMTPMGLAAVAVVAFILIRGGL